MRRVVVRTVLLAILLVCLYAGQERANAQNEVPPPLEFGPPLGAHDGQRYGTHHVEDGGRTYEDTRFGVQNPDLQGMTCFGVGWELPYHTGWDLYRLDGSSASGVEVSAVAGGAVIYANPNLNYPGAAVIIEHTIAPGQVVYSVYAHLDDNSLAIKTGDHVQRGQRLGTVMYQRYSGRFPQRHPSGDDSHLHFELRQFADGRQIYADHPQCNGLVVGRGYTYPQKPDSFPVPNAAYLDPAALLNK